MNKRTITFENENAYLDVEIHLSKKASAKNPEQKKFVLSITGKLSTKPKYVRSSSGQVREDAEKFFAGDPLFDEINRLWEAYHLNDLQPGTPEQMSALKQHHKECKTTFDYPQDIEYLKSIGLYQTKLPDGSDYRYGNGWLYEPIPEDDLEEIKFIIKTGKLPPSKMSQTTNPFNLYKDARWYHTTNDILNYLNSKSNNNLLFVTYLLIERNDVSGELKIIKRKICPAKAKLKGTVIKWYVNDCDDLSDSLSMKTDTLDSNFDTCCLGYDIINVDDEYDEPDGKFTTIGVITGFTIINLNMGKPCYNIYSDNEKRSFVTAASDPVEGSKITNLFDSIKVKRKE